MPPLLAALFLVFAGLPQDHCALGAAPTKPTRYQAVWVDAFHDGFKTPEQTKKLMEWARRHFVNALFIEVRKAGDAYYRSALEPAASDISPPGYDPLADIIRQCHNVVPGQPRIEVHAWIIIYRVGVGKPLPKTHVAVRHPEWLSQTYRDKRDENGHIHLDPGVPRVIDYTGHVVADLVRRYDLDGIHFDRIRYPSQQWGYNKTALSRLRQESRRWRRPRPDDPQWSAFRRRQIDDMLVRLYTVAKMCRPTIRVSAATVAFDDCPSDFRRSRAYYDALQNWPNWVRDGWLDLNCLMIYKRERVAEQATQYRQWLGFLAKQRGRAAALVGQGSFLNPAAASLRQIRLAFLDRSLSGVSLYSYAALASTESQGKLFAKNLRFRYFEPGVSPRIHYASDQAKYGWVVGYLTGKNVERLPVSISASPARNTQTDGSGFFAFNQVPPGTYRVAATLGRERELAESVQVTPGRVTVVRLKQE